MEGEIKRIIFEFRNSDFGYSEKNGLMADESLVDGACSLMFRPGSLLCRKNTPERLRPI